MAILNKPNINEMCPVGYHIVHAHQRICKSGIKTIVDTHTRKNKAKNILLKENIYYLYWTSQKKYPPLAEIFGFNSAGIYDSAIQFWLNYWQEQGLKFPANFDPLMIKTIIAIESGFNQNAKTNSKNSTASGLMQITNKALHIMTGFTNKKGWSEIKDNIIHVTPNDKLDPIISIALGIRWLGHKYLKIPDGSQKNSFNTVKNYYSWNSEGDLYAEKVKKLYEKSKNQ